jgi:cytochrome P450
MALAEHNTPASQRERLERSLQQGRGTPTDELHASWRARRATCPVEHVDGEERVAFLGRQAERFGDERDVFVVWANDAVARVMREDYNFWKPGPGGPFEETLLAMNGEQHREFRGLVRESFAPAAIERWEVALIDPLMHRLIDEFAPSGRADLVLDYTSHFPFHVIRALLGFRDEDHDTFVGLAYPESHGAADNGQGPEWEAALEEFIAPYIADARRAPSDNLLGTLVQAEVDGRRLSDRELFKFLVLLIPAGADTTFAGASTMWCGLLTNPDQLAEVARDPKLVARAVDEAIRWNNSAATTFLRVASDDVVVKGVDVPAGSVLACHLPSHNRDDSVYDHPDRFDIEREQPVRGVFGYGPHTCLGIHLARAEMRASVRAALARLPNLRLDPEQPEPVVQTGVAFFASPPSLPVLFDASN